jgi:CheY-like chemotaxis protein
MKKTGQILLVDDNLNDIELTRTALESGNHVGNIITARDGAEALDYLYRRGKFQSCPPGNPVVVFLDLKMPKVDGLEVLRQMKSDASLKNIPIVMLTSSREEADLFKSYELGVNAYVVKPVGFEEFVGAVRQLGSFWVSLNELPPETIGQRSLV